MRAWLKLRPENRHRTKHKRLPKRLVNNVTPTDGHHRQVRTGTDLPIQANYSGPPMSITEADGNSSQFMPKHSFNGQLAQQLGITDAIVLKYMAARTRTSTNVRSGKNWFYMTGNELAMKFPYLSKSGVEKAIKRLRAEKCIEIANFNKLSFDMTRWFHVPQEYQDASEEKPIVFEVDVAVAHGVPAAVLLHNYRYHTEKNGIEHRMSPAALNQYLPFLSKPTIKRALKKLRAANLIPQSRNCAAKAEPETESDDKAQNETG